MVDGQVQNFVEELRECFGGVANVYFCRTAHTIGLKFVRRDPVTEVSDNPDKVTAPNKPVFDPDLIVEDAKVLGRGLIKDIQIHYAK